VGGKLANMPSIITRTGKNLLYWVSAEMFRQHSGISGKTFRSIARIWSSAFAMEDVNKLAISLELLSNTAINLGNGDKKGKILAKPGGKVIQSWQ